MCSFVSNKVFHLKRLKSKKTCPSQFQQREIRILEIVGSYRDSAELITELNIYFKKRRELK